MNFASYEFWKLLFLCYLGSRLALAAAARLAPNLEGNVSKLCLLATALILLGSESILTLIAFLWVVLLGWLTILIQQKDSRSPLRTAGFVILLVFQLAPPLPLSPSPPDHSALGTLRRKSDIPASENPSHRLLFLEV